MHCRNNDDSESSEVQPLKARSTPQLEASPPLVAEETATDATDGPAPEASIPARESNVLPLELQAVPPGIARADNTLQEEAVPHLGQLSGGSKEG